MGCNSSKATGEETTRRVQQRSNGQRRSRGGGGGGGGGANPSTLVVGAAAAGGGGGGGQAGGVQCPKPWKWQDGRITRERILRMREEFWHTATAEGNTQVWGALKLVSEALLEGNAELANDILASTDIAVTGSTLQQCWDPQGNVYNVPLYCYSYPSNMIEREVEVIETKHEGPVVDVELRIRLSASADTNEQDVTITVPSNMLVQDLKQFLHEELISGRHNPPPDPTVKVNDWTGKGLPPSRQRIIYSGRVLPGKWSVQQIRFKPGTFVQVFVLPGK